jgi:hypothetical protein
VLPCVVLYLLTSVKNGRRRCIIVLCCLKRLLRCSLHPEIIGTPEARSCGTTDVDGDDRWNPSTLWHYSKCLGQDMTPENSPIMLKVSNAEERALEDAVMIYI